MIERIPKKTKTKVDLLEPLNIDILGSKDDPCFGKYFDLKAKECSRCGDSEVCHVAFSQNSHKVRKELELNNAFLDILEPEVTGEDLMDETVIRQFAQKKLDKGVKENKLIRITMRKFNLPKDKVKELITKLLK